MDNFIVKHKNNACLVQPYILILLEMFGNNVDVLWVLLSIKQQIVVCNVLQSIRILLETIWEDVNVLEDFTPKMEFARKTVLELLILIKMKHKIIVCVYKSSTWSQINVE